MALDASQIEQASRELRAAWEQGTSLGPLEERYPGLSPDDAYAIQLDGVRHWTGQGRVPVGYKVGLTNRAGQEAFGIDEPALGHLFADMRLTSGDELDLGELYQPKVEGELAFVLARDLAGPGDPQDVIGATLGVTAALEIMDTRYTDWRVKAPGLIADNCSGARFVLGSQLTSLVGLDTRHVGFVMLKNGQVAGTGAGANVMGDPLESMAWLANKLASLGRSLKAGHVVLSGASVPPVPVEAGDVIHLNVDRVGQVFCQLA